MPEAERPRSALAEGGTAAAGMCVFALFVHSRIPLVLLSALGLAAAAFAIARSLGRESPRSAVFGLGRPSRWAALLTVLGCTVGIVFGVVYRRAYERELFPIALRGFALLAALIGAAEETVYRGYIQGRVRRLGALPSIVIAALCHTAYKCALFALPASGAEIDLGFLVLWTFLGDLLVGALRELAGNLTPALAAHVCFDIIAYGDLARAPWWVWS